MELITYNEGVVSDFKFLVYKGLASPHADPGDCFFIKNTNTFQILSVLDGVSQSKSPSGSSNYLRDALKKYFSRKKTLDFTAYTEALKNISHKMMSKDYASTMTQVIITKDHVFTVNIGDSQNIIYLKDWSSQTSWPHNIGFSNEESNENSHILTNWMGLENIRLEISIFERSKVKAGLIFSDGMLDLLKLNSMDGSQVHESLKLNFKEKSQGLIQDDSSFLYFEL